MTEMMGKRQQQRRATKRNSSTVFEEEQPEMGFGAEMGPGTSKAASAALMPIEEPIYKGSMKKSGKFINEQMMAQLNAGKMDQEGIGMGEQKMAPLTNDAKPKQQRERRKPPQRKEETKLPYETYIFLD